MRISLIISIYRDVESLRIVLESLKFQTHKDFEIVVSEDGACQGMELFLREYQHPNNILHVTQPDIGWRKNQALNNAIRKSSGQYLIFIDGDCVLHHKFIENHIRFSAPNRIVAGKRIKLGPQYSMLFKNNIDELPILERRIQKELKNVRNDGAEFYEEGFYINPDGLLGLIPKLRKMHQLKGCNMSFYREAIEKINGFDEDYILPAIGEDTDLTWRFLGLGYELFSVRNLAVQYHLYHKENWISQAENLKIMEDKQKAGKFFCINGLNKNTHADHESESEQVQSDSANKQVLLFEFKFHEEIIPTQIKFLQHGGFDVHLFLEKSLWDASLFTCFPDLKITLIKNSKYWYIKLMILVKMVFYVRRHNIKYLIVNTLDSTFGHFIVRVFFRLYKVGIAHQIGKVSKSAVNRMNLNLMQGVLTLSKHTLNYLRANHPNVKNASVFYPIFFCKKESTNTIENGEIKVAIPGQLSYKRRDYQLLLQSCLKIKQYDPKIKFYLLGDPKKFDGPEIVKFINSHELEKLFWFSNERIPYDDFFHYINDADYIMPLLSTRVSNYKQYLESQTSASFNWALGLKKRLIIHKDFLHLDYTNANVITYEDDLPSKLLEINKKIKSAYIDFPQLEFLSQKASYLQVFE